jgi:DNA modification methylase
VSKVLRGDVRDVLRTLPDASVHCVVTSPPYYGLRDYQTASWSGGDPACNHVHDRTLGMRASTLEGGKATGPAASVYRECPKCGARCIDAQIGLEASPADYIATIVEVFREVRRVLRDDGTCWINLGDSMAGHNARGFRPGNDKKNGGVSNRNGVGYVEDLAPKQLMMMPARVALALQADGWWLRSDIIWYKKNPMPESVVDRPTTAHEHIFLLTKRPRYFYDAQALAEAMQDVQQDTASISVLCQEERDDGACLPDLFDHSDYSVPADRAGTRNISRSQSIPCWEGENSALLGEREGQRGECSAGIDEARSASGRDMHSHAAGMEKHQRESRSSLPLLQETHGEVDAGPCGSAQQGRPSCSIEHRSGMSKLQQQKRSAAPNAPIRNARSVWEMATEAFPEAHFATYPTELVRRCILAGTSERGCCPKCGAPWVRQIERQFVPQGNVSGSKGLRAHAGQKQMDASNGWSGVPRGSISTTTAAWSPSCRCAERSPVNTVKGLGHDPIPCTVLDPFAGAGTTLLVADRLQRDAIGIELNPDYADMAERRLQRDGGMFAEIGPAAADPQERRMADLFAEPELGK